MTRTMTTAMRTAGDVWKALTWYFLWVRVGWAVGILAFAVVMILAKDPDPMLTSYSWTR